MKLLLLSVVATAAFTLPAAQASTLHATATICPAGSTSAYPKWSGETYTYWSYLKKLHMNVVLWKLTEKVAWCTDGTHVTYFYRVRYVQVPPLPVLGVTIWHFSQWLDSGFDCADEHCWDPALHAQTRFAIARAEFAGCLIKVCAYRSATVAIRVDGDGNVVKKSANE